MVTSRCGWSLADIYIDFASASSGSLRPEYNRLLEDCRAKKLDLVITKSVSRFGRDTIDLLSAVRELRSLGIGIVFEQENIDTAFEDSELVITIIEAFMQEECASRSANTQWGLDKLAAQGICGLYKRRCFGYRNDDNGDLQIKDNEAAVVRRIFELYLGGESLVGIIRSLSNDGAKSPTGKDHWSKAAVDKLLSNEKYAGRVVLFKTYSSKRVNPVAAPRTIQNRGEFKKYVLFESHPAIISEEAFDAVQSEKLRRTNIERSNGIATRRTAKYSAKRAV
jgi:DNA invertase Pin-like site-specific DNA recombinase